MSYTFRVAIFLVITGMTFILIAFLYVGRVRSSLHSLGAMPNLDTIPALLKDVENKN